MRISQNFFLSNSTKICFISEYYKGNCSLFFLMINLSSEEGSIDKNITLKGSRRDNRILNNEDKQSNYFRFCTSGFGRT